MKSEQTHKPMPQDGVAGMVERVTFYNEEPGFSVLRVKVKAKRDLLTVVGSVAEVSAGEWVATLRSYCFAIGGWVSQHARQRVLKLSLPRSKRPWMDSFFRQIDARPPPFDYSSA